MNKVRVKLGILIFLLGCSQMKYTKTVNHVDLSRFAGDWYVVKARPTFFEKDVYNGIENYQFDSNEVKIRFSFNQGGFEGKEKVIKQKGTIHNKTTNAHWKVSPMWPLKFDFLIIDLAEDYSWTAVGVPSTDYLWIMARRYDHSTAEIEAMIQSVAAKGYPVHDLKTIAHQY